MLDLTDLLPSWHTRDKIFAEIYSYGTKCHDNFSFGKSYYVASTKIDRTIYQKPIPDDVNILSKKKKKKKKKEEEKKRKKTVYKYIQTITTSS